MYRILVADAQVIFRKGVKRIIEDNNDCQVVGEVSDWNGLLEILKVLKVDMVITDFMPNLAATKAIREIKIISQAVKVLILTMHRDKDYFYRALSAGADGYLLKEDANSELISAIDTLRKGGTYISPLLSTQLASDFQKFPTAEQLAGTTELLTPMEMQILKLIAKGKSITEIGKMLNTGTGMIKNQRRNIMRKLKINTTADFHNFANKYGYIDNLAYVEKIIRGPKQQETFTNNKPFILRSIEFSPEHHEAGLTILSYFGKIVRQKYAGMKVNVSIEQEDLTVRMIIKTDQGNIDKIEKTLEEYGLVIKGEMPINEFITDPYQVAELKHQLRIAHVQLESQKELLALTKNMHEQRIYNLEEEVIHLRSCIAKGLELLDNKDIILESAIRLIDNKLTKDINQQDFLEIKEALEKIRERDQTIFSKIVNKINVLCIQGSISGVAGNLLYDFIKSLVKLF
jgi:two-component system, NarL family, response regulator NreC